MALSCTLSNGPYQWPAWPVAWPRGVARAWGRGGWQAGSGWGVPGLRDGVGDGAVVGVAVSGEDLAGVQ